MKIFWLIILLVTVSWYAVVTLQVVRKGWKDVKRLLQEAGR